MVIKAVKWNAEMTVLWLVHATQVQVLTAHMTKIVAMVRMQQLHVLARSPRREIPNGIMVMLGTRSRAKTRLAQLQLACVGQDHSHIVRTVISALIAPKMTRSSVMTVSGLEVRKDLILNAHLIVRSWQGFVLAARTQVAW